MKYGKKRYRAGGSIFLFAQAVFAVMVRGFVFVTVLLVDEVTSGAFLCFFLQLVFAVLVTSEPLSDVRSSRWPVLFSFQTIYKNEQH